jgi:hypothetical protein
VVQISWRQNAFNAALVDHRTARRPASTPRSGDARSLDGLHDDLGAVVANLPEHPGLSGRLAAPEELAET